MALDPALADLLRALARADAARDIARHQLGGRDGESTTPPRAAAR